jgi:hypothetical protein
MKRSTMKILAGTILAGAAIGTIAAESAKSDATKRTGETTPITRPAIPDGSNASRAPIPAARPLDDVTPPNGEAFDHKLAPTPPAPSAARANPAHRGANAAATTLDAGQVQTEIHSASFDTRDRFVDDVRSRVRESRQALSDLRPNSSDMSKEARDAFKAAIDDAREREKALQRSLRAAQHADAANWETARAQVSADFDAYVAALARVDSTAGPAPVH